MDFEAEMKREKSNGYFKFYISGETETRFCF